MNDFFLRIFLKILKINEIKKHKLNIIKYEKCSGQKINFISQGNFNLTISGDLKKFKIHRTSHLKSDTFIECTGGVQIGKYLHTGRGLTIFTTNHNYNSKFSIPYDEVSIKKPVIIKDFVWIGANVTIVPGVEVGEGVVIGSGAVVTKNVPKCAIVGGNPAKILKYRDLTVFNDLKLKGQYF